MRKHQARLRGQAGTSVLAALVFVAIFVLFISGYKIASQSAQNQSAAVASVTGNKATNCVAGSLFTVNMESGAGSVQSLTCFVPDPIDPSVMIPGPDSARAECSLGVQKKCVVQYCPPSSFMTDSGTCFSMATCDPASDSVCLKSAIQNASQPVQAANIIAAQLLSDRGATNARVPGASGSFALAEKLSESGRVAVTNIIDETAAAAAANDLDSDALRSIARAINSGQHSRVNEGPAAQISCQPKIAESGMKVGIAFGCANSTSGEGGGFSTGGRLWGATEERIPANLPNGTMTYELMCSDGQETARATCAVAVVKPFMLFTSQTGTNGASFAWVTRGMDLCELSARGNTELSALFGNLVGNPVPPNGALFVPPVFAETDVVLMCTTVGGVVKEAKTTVHVAR